MSARLAATIALIFGLVASAEAQRGQTSREMTQGDFVLKDFHFRSGETLDVAMHYRVLGRPIKDSRGIVENAVLILHGTGGTGAQFLANSFSLELFEPGQPLDFTRYFLIVPDDLGHGQSSKPSDGLRARFPKYGYLDMVEAEYRLVTEGL
jgi:homoserine O-acetyltransferase/O-succinyltransferase